RPRRPPPPHWLTDSRCSPHKSLALSWGGTPAARGAHRCPRRSGRTSTNNPSKNAVTLLGKGFSENGGSRKGNCVESGYVTLEQVAAHAGVSLATAYRVINGSTRQLSQRLRDKVNASAPELS